MKNFIIVLLIAAAAAAAYFMLRRQPSEKKQITQEQLIVGSWKVDSLDFSSTSDSSGALLAALLFSVDSNSQDYSFEFTKDGRVLEKNDTTITSTTRYELTDNKFYIWEDDSTKHAWRILQLDSAKFVTKSNDSIVFYLIR